VPEMLIIVILVVVVRKFGGKKELAEFHAHEIKRETLTNK